MTAVARGLDAAALLLALLLLGILATGGWKVAGLALTRPEDVLLALVVVAAARALAAPLRLPEAAPGRVVVAGVAVYAVLMGFITVTRHRALLTHALDLGYYVQVVWSLAHGLPPRVSLPPMHAWGDHLSPILYALVPLGWLSPVAPALLLAQTLILAAGGLAVYAFARRRLEDDALAAGFALLYLVNPSLHGINVRDIHPQAFAIPLLIAAALALDTGRWGWCAAALVLTAGCREDAAIPLVGFGLWAALARRRWKVGAGIAVAAVALLTFDTRVLMPYFRGEPYPHLVKRYSHLGSSVSDVLITLVARPWRWVPVLVNPLKLMYLAALLAPLAFLPLLAPLALAGALPALAVNLLTFDRVLFHHRTQYQAFVLPFLILAAVDGCATFRAWAARRRWTRPSPRVVLIAALLVSVALTSRTINDLMVTRWRLGPEQRAARALARRIPDGVPVSVNERLQPHLALRPEAYIFPTAVERSQYVLELDSVLARRPLPPGFVVEVRERGWTLLRRE
ncbi:MAG TPA: DUF2079 domain-containing protein [Candidatus Binatia bacterium]|nr:DUF2079 domain-containing protein [Candidatus Binatia bacterium]